MPESEEKPPDPLPLPAPPIYRGSLAEPPTTEEPPG